MRHVPLKEALNGTYFFPVEREPEPPTTIIRFSAKDGFTFTVEKHFLHEPETQEIRPSSRGDGTTHYFEESSFDVVIHNGPDVIEKAEMFTKAYLAYAQHYCTFTG